MHSTQLAEALELRRAGILFPSVDLDDFEFVYADADADADGTRIEDISDEEWGRSSSPARSRTPR
ncbi:hypothetical protein ACIBMZ_26750 [Micromonospora sp. NPDC049900]|uniref:hypothetical protein n=1 Tax=Micromonospora sp. NPDC049900 TaxID=3364275 RepID=UPI0037A3A578